MDRIIEWDRQLFLLLNGMHWPWLDPVMAFFSKIPVWIPLYLAIAFFLFYKKSRREGLLSLAALILCLVLTDQLSAQIIKEAVQRLRPSHTESLVSCIHLLEDRGGLYGFVSSHAANTMGLACFTALVFRKKGYTAFIFLWASIVSYSRIYVGKHFPIDVLCGAILGLSVGYGVYLLYKYVLRLCTCRPPSRNLPHPPAVRLIADTQTDPYWNLAAEEYLLTQNRQNVVRLWRNDPAVIVGRYQNTAEEIVPSFIEERHIRVVRRLSGGGAVFHDPGNVNFSFFAPRPPCITAASLFERFTAPVVQALQALQIPVTRQGRNELMIADKKCSGNAMAVHARRIMVHGTLLYDAALFELGAALRAKLPASDTREASPAVQTRSRYVASTPSKVCNIIDYMPDRRSVEAFMAYLQDALAPNTPASPWSRREVRAINRLCRTKYRTAAWNYGVDTGFNYTEKKRFGAGTVEIHLLVKRRTIRKARILGDYFSLSSPAQIEKRLRGCPCTREAVRKRLKRHLDPETFDRCFQNLRIEDFLSLFPKNL